MTEDEMLIEARKRLAAQFYQPYHINAIMGGDWDRGSLLQHKLLDVRAEQGSQIRKRKPTANCEPQSA